MSHRYLISGLSLLILLTSFGFAPVFATSNPKVDITIVDAEVLGDKPMVNNFDPTTGQNDGATAITAIVGHNFTGAALVSLDDPRSTTLTGTITVLSGCDDDPTNAACGADEGYDKITGLSVPVGVTPGIYNLLVTNAQGTNIASDVKLTVSSPPPGADAQIDSVSPSTVYVNIGASQAIDINVSDTNSTNTYFNISTSNGGSFTPTQNTIAMSSGLGTGSTTFTAGGSTGLFTNTFQASDDSAGGPYDDNKTIDFYVQPAW